MASPYSQHTSPGVRTMGRILVLALVFGVAAFSVLTLRLWQLQMMRHDELEGKAIEQQTREFPSAAPRGTIRDRNGEELAVSASVQNVVLCPRDVLALVPTGEGSTAEERKEDRQKKLRAEFDFLARELSVLLKKDQDAIRKKLEKTNSAWEVLAKAVEVDTADRVRDFIEVNGLEDCVILTADTRRYYPQGSLAAHAIGFVNGENHGAYGLEAAFDDTLAGKKGRLLTAKNAAGSEMPVPYTALDDGLAGSDLQLTLDAGIQRFAEKTLREGVQKYDAVNGGFCIVMEPKTGALLALASYPDYDLNRPGEILDGTAASRLERMKNNPSLDRDALQKEKDRARFLQWSSKYLNTAYEPGSTFKPIVMSAALEEGAVTPEDRFHCAGVMNVGGWPIRCSKRTGHGSQTLREALMNSCNPAHIVIGQRLGAKKFYEYWQAFGFPDRTGIELPGESGSRFWPEEEFVSPNGLTSLATASFGQRFLVTPLQMAAALSAVVNGGHLMEPYLVASVTGPDGTVLRERQPREVRQVISQETSDTVRGFMEQVVAAGTGKNAAVEGYRIGGKTGSSQTGEKDRTIVSFAGFAPADDPAVLVLLAYDCPRPAAPGSTLTAGGLYISGGAMAAPMAGELIANILDYLGYEKEGTENVTLPPLIGDTPTKAKSELAELGLEVRTVGEGVTVTEQTPPPGTAVPKGGTVALTLGGEEVFPGDADQAAFLGIQEMVNKALEVQS